jgi:hypothetical protein
LGRRVAKLLRVIQDLPRFVRQSHPKAHLDRKDVLLRMIAWFN